MMGTIMASSREVPIARLYLHKGTLNNQSVACLLRCSQKFILGISVTPEMNGKPV
jgi:hypothetical protein